jgi:uncharacterized protein (TIRG00374 family)
VIAALKHGCQAVVRRPWLRVAVQAVVSVALMAVLVRLVPGGGQGLRMPRPGPLIVALGLFLMVIGLNSYRWQLLLRQAGICDPLGRLIRLNFIGLFCSLFLPSSAGGDAVRIYDVARRKGRPAEVVLATLQERFLGLGASLLVGLIATLYYLPRLPAEVRLPVLLLEMAGTVGSVALLYPAPVLRLAQSLGKIKVVAALTAQPLVARLITRLRPLTEVKPLRRTTLAGFVGLGLLAALVTNAFYYVLGQGLDCEASFFAFCLVVPLVALVRQLPISLNGIGVGEGAFVVLLGYFAVPEGQALAVSLAYLALQFVVALPGGLFLLLRMMRSGRSKEAIRIRSSSIPIAAVPVALLAGGLATRLRPITATIPKALVEVAGRPFIDHQLALLQSYGIRRVVLCLGYLGEQVEAHLGDGSRFGMELRYAHDGDRLRGTGGALRRALPLLGEVFWVMYGDSYMDIDYPAVLGAFAQRDVLGLMTVLHNNNSWDSSNVVFQDGRLLRYDKRARLPEMTHIDYGVALLRRAALLRIPPDQPADLADLYGALVAEGQMIGYEVTRRFYEIGSPRGLEETRDYLTKRAA